MKTIEEIREEFKIRQDVLFGASIGFKNANALVQLQEEGDVHGILRNGFFVHLYRTYRFVIVTELAKLVTTTNSERYTIKKLVKEVKKSPAAYNEYYVRTGINQLSRDDFNKTIDDLYNSFIGLYKDETEKVVQQRIHIYAHTTGVSVPGIPDEKLERTILAVQGFLNSLNGLVFGTEFLYSSTSSWSIQRTLMNLKYSHEIWDMLTVNDLQRAGETDEYVAESLNKDEDYVKGLFDELKELKSRLCK